MNGNSPPFPNPNVKPAIANVPTIRFAPLLDRDEVELAKLVAACETVGFFYVDLSDEGSNKMFTQLEAVSDLVKLWMKQPREKKCQTVTSKSRITRLLRLLY